MAVDFSALLYLPVFDFYAREIVVTPIVSQPGQPAYTARGIFDTDPVDIHGLDDTTIIGTQKTIVDVRDREFTVVPMQGDLIHIPAEGNIPAAGDFEVVDGDENGGGETTLTIRKWEAPTAVDTTLAILSDINPTAYGEQPTFTATVSAGAAGVVCFKVDGETRAYVMTVEGVASWAPGWSLRVGNHAIVAQFSPSDPLAFKRSQNSLVQAVT